MKKPSGTSRLKNFYRKSVDERRALVASYMGAEGKPIGVEEQLPISTADSMVENAIGTMEVPLGVATNFQINGVDVLVPMAIEEPSVIAAASNAARMVRMGSGFVAEVDPPHTVVQVELLNPAPGAAAPWPRENAVPRDPVRKTVAMPHPGGRRRNAVMDPTGPAPPGTAREVQ